MRRLSVLALISGLAGCAYIDRHVELPTLTKAEPVFPGRGRVIVQDFSDSRADPAIVGEYRNGLDIVSAHVLLDGDTDAGQWFAAALAMALAASGYDVDRTTAGDSSAGAVTVGGSILEIYHRQLSYVDHQIRFRMVVRARVVRSDGTVTLDREFDSEGAYCARTEGSDEFQRALTDVFLDLMNKSVPEIAKAALDPVYRPKIEQPVRYK